MWNIYIYYIHKTTLLLLKKLHIDDKNHKQSNGNQWSIFAIHGLIFFIIQDDKKYFKIVV